MEQMNVNFGRVAFLKNLKANDKKLSTFDGIIIFFTIFLILIAFMMSTAFIASALFAGIGIVVGLAIVIHKFDYVRKLVVKFDKWFDLTVLLVGFALAGSAQAMASAAFASILISAYLVIARMVYAEDVSDFSLIPDRIKKFFNKRKGETNASSQRATEYSGGGLLGLPQES